MNLRRVAGVFLVAGSCLLAGLQPAAAQCCLDGLFAGCLSCCKKPPVYAVAPMAPVAAPLIAPVAPMAAIPAPPPPVMVPVQQTSYVPETTYRTEYKCVPVTSYKPSCEIDPCTGCPIECMQQVTQYVQQPVSVPVTQYRAVTTTKYVQMQPGYSAPGYPAAPAAPAAAMPPAASPFSAVQTTPQAWGAAGADVSRQPLPGVAAPALPPAGAPPATTYQYSQPAPGTAIMPQSGVTAITSQQPQQLQPTQPPALAPAPSLRPIPAMPRAGQPAGPGTSGLGSGAVTTPSGGATTPPNGSASPAPAAGQQDAGQGGMPVLPGAGPGAATGAFPRLLAPTSHTTSWQPSGLAPNAVQYPTAALPAWRGQR